MNIAARSSELTLILWSLFPQFLRNMIASFKMLKFPSNCGYFWKWVGWNGTQIFKPLDYDENGKSRIFYRKGYSNLKTLFVLKMQICWSEWDGIPNVLYFIFLQCFQDNVWNVCLKFSSLSENISQYKKNQWAHCWIMKYENCIAMQCNAMQRLVLHNISYLSIFASRLMEISSPMHVIWHSLKI